MLIILLRPGRELNPSWDAGKDRMTADVNEEQGCDSVKNPFKKGSNMDLMEAIIRRRDVEVPVGTAERQRGIAVNPFKI